MAKYFRFPWAINGDKTEIPDPTQSNGAVSYQQGYGAAYAADPETDPTSRDIEREMYNQALFDVTETLQQYYQRSVPPFIAATDNGGLAFGYPQYARVLFNNRVYESLINNNTNLPTVTTAWRLADFAGLDARYALQSALGTAAALNTGTATGDIPLIGTPGTDTAGANSAVMVRSGSNGNGNFLVWSNGLIVQIFPWVKNAGFSGFVTINFPTAFLSGVLCIVPQSGNGVIPLNISNTSLTQTRIGGNRHWTNISNVGSGNLLAMGF